jgi:uncharacterized membrane protein
MSFGRRVLDIIRREFISGVLVVVPVILTYIVIRFLFEAIDGILNPFIVDVFGYYVPGLGLVTTLLLILLAGFFARSFIGHQILKLGDRLLRRTPVIRPIYTAAKQLLEAMASTSDSTFKEVGLIEYPRKGIYAIGFLSRRIELDVSGVNKVYWSVFMASTPTPVSGMVVIIPEEEVIKLEMTVEEGVKFLVSGGVASPALIKRKPAVMRNESGEVTR